MIKGTNFNGKKNFRVKCFNAKVHRKVGAVMQSRQRINNFDSHRISRRNIKQSIIGAVAIFHFCTNFNVDFFGEYARAKHFTERLRK